MEFELIPGEAGPAVEGITSGPESAHLLGPHIMAYLSHGWWHTHGEEAYCVPETPGVNLRRMNSCSTPLAMLAAMSIKAVEKTSPGPRFDAG